MKNPRIAPQKWSKIKGARFGKDVRKKWNADNTKLLNKPHYGLDIKNKVDDPVYSMYGGTIDATGNDKEGWGKW